MDETQLSLKIDESAVGQEDMDFDLDESVIQVKCGAKPSALHICLVRQEVNLCHLYSNLCCGNCVLTVII